MLTLLFESSLSQLVAKEESSTHPIYLFKLENREIKKLTDSIKEYVDPLIEEVAGMIFKEENILFPRLIRKN